MTPTPPTDDTYAFANGIRVKRDHLIPVQLQRYAAGVNIHEPVEEEWILKLLKSIPPGPATFADIGAAIGYYCILVGKHRPDTALHAYEPDPDNHPRILDNAGLNTIAGITIHPEAVADRVGQGTLVGSGFTGFLDYSGRGQGRAVQTTTIDAMVAALGPIQLVKIDIQGGEVAALVGADLSLRTRAVANWVIGTHSAPIHARCLEVLRLRSYRIIFESLRVEHQPDGIIIAATGKR